MASYRIGIGSFNLKDGAVGIGTESTGLGNLKVEGTIKTTDLDVGVSTFTRYSGFEGEEAKFDKDVNLSGEYSTTGDIVVEPGAILTVGLGSTACVGSVECISVKHHFSVPVGDTAGRNKSSGYTEGTVRYNRDLGTMEFFNGNEWRQFNYQSDAQNSPSRRGRGIFSGGGYPSYGNAGPIIEFIQISTLGNSTNFGTNTLGILSAGNSDNTRGTFSGGFDPFRDVIEYITMASEGNVIDFGDLTDARAYAGSASSSTRGLIIGGYGPAYVNTIDYIEIQTLGNALDFGDCTRTKAWDASTQSPVRGVFMSGTSTVPNCGIDFVITSTKGNAVNFGETTKGRRAATGGGNSVRGIFVGGYLGNADQLNTMDYVTLASEGNAIDFGDNLFTGSYSGATSNGNRMVIAGGYNAPATRTNSISHVTIATTGNAQDFGDMLSGGASGIAAVSDSHGGLGGF